MLPLDIENVVLSFIINKKHKLNTTIQQIVKFNKVQIAQNFRYGSCFVDKDYNKIDDLFSRIYYNSSATEWRYCSRLSPEFWWHRKITMGLL